ncbi:hypothetical protein HYI36_05005 [Bacillus sp. Gen3]|nr:hypothetical protein [Bacillus sp. Gen3]
MREIKFRGYAVEEMANSQWVEGFGVYEIKLAEHYVKEVGRDSDWVLYTYSGDYRVDPKSIGQYTGLKDKNGKEIYEGDILKAQKSISDETEVYFRVKYTGAAFALVHPEYHNTIYMEVMPWYVRETAEVIGNIYENSSLLEVSHEQS